MTKDAELKLLAKVICMFGPDSYVGPWLDKHKTDIDWSIRNDFPIDPLPKKDSHADQS